MNNSDDDNKFRRVNPIDNSVVVHDEFSQLFVLKLRNDPN